MLASTFTLHIFEQLTLGHTQPIQQLFLSTEKFNYCGLDISIRSRVDRFLDVCNVTKLEIVEEAMWFE